MAKVTIRTRAAASIDARGRAARETAADASNSGAKSEVGASSTATEMRGSGRGSSTVGIRARAALPAIVWPRPSSDCRNARGSSVSATVPDSVAGSRAALQAARWRAARPPGRPRCPPPSTCRRDSGGRDPSPSLAPRCRPPPPGSPASGRTAAADTGAPRARGWSGCSRRRKRRGREGGSRGRRPARTGRSVRPRHGPGLLGRHVERRAEEVLAGVVSCSWARRAMPKSRILGSPEARSTMFAGLTSRCTTPGACA